MRRSTAAFCEFGRQTTTGPTHPSLLTLHFLQQTLQRFRTVTPERCDGLPFTAENLMRQAVFQKIPWAASTGSGAPSACHSVKMWSAMATNGVDPTESATRHASSQITASSCPHIFLRTAPTFGPCAGKVDVLGVGRLTTAIMWGAGSAFR